LFGVFFFYLSTGGLMGEVMEPVYL
jgi:hypothetical protein